MLKKITQIIILICFVTWIVPLGAFIKPSQEDEMCNGRRSICLCTHFLAKHKAELAKVKSFRATPAPQKQIARDMLSSPDFIASRFHLSFFDQHTGYNVDQIWLYDFFYSRPIEHVPKHFS
ncbi:MAG: hypothetical protein KC618_03500 [Candidatus Omnitrophica bacterium]|nr:hypothetical protein [Candidatus Omnitrophota bacterium]